nr:hypothetical protein [Candidatus Sigynarchaeum springense]
MVRFGKAKPKKPEKKKETPAGVENEEKKEEATSEEIKEEGPAPGNEVPG